LRIKGFIANQLATGKDIEQRSSKPAADHPWINYGHKIKGKPVPLTYYDILTLP
jgi:hypothetical protein